MYVKVTNDQPEIYTIRQLQRDNPNVSFPATPTNTSSENYNELLQQHYAALAVYDVYPVTILDRPITERWQHAVRNDLPTQNENGDWVLEWTVKDIPATSEMVKAEAQRRILHILPEWKQRNLTARAAELAIKGAQNWSLDEQEEVAAGQALWDQIKTIRVKSDELEALDPIPVDYTDDKYWT